MSLLQKLHLPTFDTLALVFVVWFCSLPLIFLVIMPLLGFKMGLGLALAFLLLMIFSCWGVCMAAVARLYLKQRTG